MGLLFIRVVRLKLLFNKITNISVEKRADSKVPETFIIQKEMSISTLKGEAEAITTAATIITTTEVKTEARVLITEAI